MDAVLTPVLRNMYYMTYELLRVRVIDSIEAGDVTLDELRDTLQTEFEKMQEMIDKLLIAPLKAAEENVKLGLHHVHFGDVAAAKDYFKSAEQNAITAFTTAPSFDGKVLATRLQLISTFHIHGYFGETCNMGLLQAVCSTVFDRLLSVTEVQSAIRDGGKNGLIFKLIDDPVKKAKRFSVLSEMFELGHFLELHLLKPYSMKIPGTTGKNFEAMDTLNHLTVVTEKLSVNVMCIYLNKLYAAGYGFDTLIRIFDINSFELVGSLKFRKHHSVDALLVSKGVLYCGGGRTVMVWDLETGVEISSMEDPVNEHVGSITCFAVHGQYLFSGMCCGKMLVWSVKDSLTFVRNININHYSSIKAIAVQCDSLYIGSSNGKVGVWNCEEDGVITFNTFLQGLPDKSDEAWYSGPCAVCNLVITNDGQTLYAQLIDGAIYGWNCNTFELLTENFCSRPDEYLPLQAMCLHEGYIYSSLGIYDVNAGLKEIRPMPQADKPIVSQLWPQDITCVVVSGAKLIVACRDSRIRVYLINHYVPLK